MSKAPVSNVVANMKKQEEARLERRAKAEEQKLAKLARAQANSDANKVCDIDFDELIAAER
jgi:kinesin family protein 2/24